MGMLIWILALVGFGFLLYRISELETRLARLERKLPVETPQLEARAVSAPPWPAPPAPPAPPATPAMSPKANARSAPEPVGAPAPTVLWPPAREPARGAGGDRLRAWLEENGLAWAGGAVLALGGLFLAAYAAQRGMFTPPLRIAAATAVGLALVGVSEWLRRGAESDIRGHRLAAALAAGAGAATLYGAAWAAHSLYGLVGLAGASVLLGVTSLGLLALAFRHGEPLALLALVGGFLAPALTGVAQWSAAGLTVYLALLIATGYGAAALRRWSLAAFVTLSGAACWCLVAVAAESPLRAMALALGPVAAAFAAAEWSRRRPAEDRLAAAFDLSPPAAFLAAAFLLFAVGMLEAAPAYGAGGAILLTGLGAVGVWRGLLAPPVQLAAYIACLAPLFWRLGWPQTDPGPLWLAALGLASAGGGLACALTVQENGRRWGGAGAAAALALAVAIGAGGWPAWAPEALTCALLLGGAGVLVRAGGPSIFAPASWVWTAGAAAIAAVHEGVDPRATPVAMAGLAAVVAAVRWQLGWRGFGAVTVAAGLATLATLIAPAMIAALQAGRLGWPWFALETAASAALVFLAARITGRRVDGRPSAEALSTGALFVLLAGAFMMLRPWGPAGALDPFLEAGLRTLLLAVAGLCAALSAARPDPKNEAPASGDSPGLIGRWLGQALLLLALGHATLCQVLLFNPLWAGWRPAVAGPPLLDSLAAGLLAPAVVLAFATLARVSVRRWLLGIYAAGAAVMTLMWELLELRRLFQGPTLHGAIDAVGRTEVAAYALAALSAAWATAWLGDLADRRRLTVSPLAPQLAGVGRAGAWASLAFCLLVFGYLASPWWGPLQRPLDSAADALLLLALYSAAAAGLLLAELRSPCGQGLLGRALRMGSVAVSFALVTLLVRIGFRGLDLRPDGREAGLETWTFSAVWGLFGFALLIAGVARRVNDLRLAGLAVLMATLAKVFVFDLSRLEGVVRAGSFLAVGAVLLAAAVLARRLSGEAGGWSMRRGRRAGAAHQAD